MSRDQVSLSHVTRMVPSAGGGGGGCHSCQAEKEGKGGNGRQGSPGLSLEVKGGREGTTPCRGDWTTTVPQSTRGHHHQHPPTPSEEYFIHLVDTSIGFLCPL